MKELYSKPAAHLIAIVLFGFIAYSNTFNAPFMFDDNSNIVKNYRIRDISNIPGFFTDPGGPFASRPVMHATFAVNYFFGGLDPAGYHAFNMAVHLLNGVLLYLLIAMTGRHLGYSDKDFGGIALLSALLFTLHPVQTEAVTNIVNRSMLLAAAFYFSGMMLFLRAVTTEKRKGLYIAGLLVVSVLGMGSRENFAVFPVALVLFDMCFVSSFSFRRMAMNLKLYLPVLLGLGYMAFLIFENTYSKNSAPGGIPPVEYAITELRVLWTYMRLLILPMNLTIEYNYPLSKTLFGLPAVLSLAGYAGMWIAGIALLRRKPGASFLVLWPLVLLLPISFGVAFMGLRLDDVIFEHRLYLPGAGLMVAASIGAVLLIRRTPSQGKAIILLLGALLLTFSFATYHRNAVWQSEENFWQDAMSKAPEKARVWASQGDSLVRLGRFEEALDAYEKALKLAPDSVQTWTDAGYALHKLNENDEAVKAFERAIELNPDYSPAWYSKGTALVALERYEEALAPLEKAAELQPDYAAAWDMKGVALSRLGRYEDALASLEKATELQPDYAEAWFNKGLVLSALGRYEESLSAFETVVGLSPDNAEALYNKGFGLGKLGRFQEAIAALDRAIELKPDYAEAWNVKGICLGSLGRYGEARVAFEMALELNPDYTEARNNLDHALKLMGGQQE